MSLYRTINKLRLGGEILERGALTTLGNVSESGREELVRVGAVSVVHSPPLRELPAWRGRARKLEDAGIISAEGLVTADPNELAVKAGTSVSKFRRWQAEAQSLLSPPLREEC